MCLAILSFEVKKIKVNDENPAIIAANRGPLIDSRTSRIFIGVPLKAKQIKGIIIKKLAIVYPNATPLIPKRTPIINETESIVAVMIVRCKCLLANP